MKLLIVGSTLLAACLSMCDAFITVDTESGHFVDDSDLSHDNTTTSLTQDDMKQLREWGFNVLRLGIQWDGTEPNSVAQPGVFNMSYLATMRGLVDTLGTFGIYSIADMHEDALSRYYCGEGIPDAYISPNATAFHFPSPLPLSLPLGPDGYPDIAACVKVNFGLYLYTIAAQASWGSMYANSSSMQHAMAHFWTTVGAVFNDSEYLLAHELINEPQAGNAYADPLDYLIPGQGDQKNLAPLYRLLYQAIRSTDKNHMVMFEPAVSETVLRQETGFTSGPGGPDDAALSVFAYHLYCFNQNATGDITNVTDCQSNLDAYWQLETANKKKVGGGSFMTEFGAVGPNPSSAEALGVWGDLADTELESWTYWSYKNYADITTQNPATETLYNADGSLQTFKVSALSRTYAQAIAGVPSSISMFYNSTTFDFSLTYEINSALPQTAQTTTVYLNQNLHYPSGFQYVIRPSGIAQVSQAEPNYLTITHAPGASGTLSFSLSATM